MATEYRYHKVSPSFWTDRKVLAWDDDTRLLALYIMTCEHRTTEGLFRLPKAYICADMGWSAERLDIPFAILLRDGFIKYDETVSVMLLTNALKWNSTDNVNHAKGAVKTIVGLPETPLLSDFIRLAERYDERLHKQLEERYGKPQALTQALTQTQTQEQTDHAYAREEPPSPSNNTPPEEPETVGPSVGLPEPNDDMTFADVTQRYHRRIGMLGPTISNKLAAWIHDNGMNPGVLAKAIDITAEAREEKRIRGHPDQYLEGVIRGMYNDGICTVKALRESEGPQTDDEWVAAIMAQAAKAEGG